MTFITPPMATDWSDIRQWA